MKIAEFKLGKEQLKKLNKFSKDGKSSNIGKMAIEIVKMYFESKNPSVKFENGDSGTDIKVIIGKTSVCYEVKGTQDRNIAYYKLKVSGKQSHSALVIGVELIRIANIGKKDIKLYFLKYGQDFILNREPR